MSHGKSGMGMSKHRKSGNAGYSPKLRHSLARDASTTHARKSGRRQGEMFDNIAEAMRQR